MTKPDGELTIAEVTEWAIHTDMDDDGELIFERPRERAVARALLASQKALRSSCEGCSKNIPLTQNGTRTGHWGTWDSWFPGDKPMEGTKWLTCKLTDEQRAALLKKRESDDH